MLAQPDDLKTLLGIEDLDESRAMFLLEGVSEEITRFTNISFEKHVGDVVTLDGSGTTIILLPGLPVASVASVVEGETELVEGDDYEWNGVGILKRRGCAWSQHFRNVVVTYTHGHDDVPASVRNLACRVAARSYVNPTAVTNESEGGYVAGYGFDATRHGQLSDADKALLREFMGS